MVRVLVFTVGGTLIPTAAYSVLFTPATVWLTALTAAPVMVLVMGLALLPILAMAVEGAYLGVVPITAEKDPGDAVLQALLVQTVNPVCEEGEALNARTCEAATGAGVKRRAGAISESRPRP